MTPKEMIENLILKLEQGNPYTNVMQLTEGGLYSSKGSPAFG